MSYDIYFLKNKQAKQETIFELLEADASPTDAHFISKELMLEIKDLLSAAGLKFEVFERAGEDYLELNFSTYQLSMFNNQIALSLPFWDENNTVGVNGEVKRIANVLLDKGFIGFDPQTEEFITEKFEFKTGFREAKEVVDKQFQTSSTTSESYKWVGVVVAAVLLALLMWKMLRSS